MPDPRITWTQEPNYPDGRLVARLGQVEAGAVFPPYGTPRDRLPWVWRCWLIGGTTMREGRAKTELAAKNALAACIKDKLRQMDLTSAEGGV